MSFCFWAFFLLNYTVELSEHFQCMREQLLTDPFCKVVPVIDQEYESNDVLSVLVFKFHVGSIYVFCYAITSHSKIWVLLSTNPGQISLSGSYANLHGDSKLVVLTSH